MTGLLKRLVRAVLARLGVRTPTGGHIPPPRDRSDDIPVILSPGGPDAMRHIPDGAPDERDTPLPGQRALRAIRDLATVMAASRRRIGEIRAPVIHYTPRRDGHGRATLTATQPEETQ